MIKKKAKFSCTRHPEAVAASYCKECKMFMCAENCQGIHDNFFGKMHQVVLADTLTDFDLSGGKCGTHNDYVFDFVCKDCACKFSLMLYFTL